MQADASNRSVSESLSSRSLHAVKWNYIGVVARIVSQIVVQVGLARLLGPDAFGLFALAFMVVGVGNIVVEMGLGAALVQRKEVCVADVRHVYTLSVCLGLLMTSIACLGAPLLAMLFDDARVTSVVRGLSVAFILQALAVTPLSLLKRDLDFKRVQIAQVGSYLFGFLVVGLGLAWLHAGVWSLVAAWLAQTAVLTGTAYIMRPHSLLPLMSGGDPAIRRYGVRVLLTNLSNWAIENLDNFLVGRFFGAKALGLYSVSYNLVRAPATHLVTALQTTLFSAASRAQDNEAGLQRAYLTAVSGVSLIAIPIFSAIATVAPTVVDALLGAKWAGAEGVLRPLALAMAAHALMAVAGPVLWGKGAVGTEFKIQVLVAVLLVFGLVLARGHSVAIMAWVVFGVYALRFMVMTAALLSLLKISLRAFWGALRGGLVAGCVVVLGVAILDTHASSLSSLPRLVADIGLAGAALVLLVFALPKVVVSKDLGLVLMNLDSVTGSGFLTHRLSPFRRAAWRSPE